MRQPRRPVRTLPGLLAESVRWKGDDPLFEDETDQLRAPEVLDTVARVAAGLASRGVGRGDRVAFVVGSSARHAIAFFACTWLGAVPCALHSRDTPVKLAASFPWLNSDVLIT